MKKQAILLCIFLIALGCLAKENPPPTAPDNGTISCGYCQFNDGGVCKSYQCCFDNECHSDETCINHLCERKPGCAYANPPCDASQNCIGNKCVLKSGCAYNNPVCQEDHECLNNTCSLKKGCTYSNPPCQMNEDCINGSCVKKGGCLYDNPPCGPSYDCVDNACLLKTGCQYDNPPCDSGQNCEANQCINQCVVPSDLTITTETINGQFGSSDYDVYTRPGSDIRVVCRSPCPISQLILKRKYTALEKAIDNLTSITGVPFVGHYTPIDFHYTSDGICGNYVSEMTGFYMHTPDDYGAACLFSYEKNNPLMPFDKENACRQVGLLLEVHEATHAMFDDTQVSYWIQEGFTNLLAFHIAGNPNGGDMKSDSSFDFGISACDERMRLSVPLNHQLCELYGIDVSSYRQIFRAMDARRRAGKDVTDHDFKDILDNIAGEDTSDAFIAANMTLVT